MIVRRIVLDEVQIPARADSINSPEVDYALHKLPVGGKQGWTQQFDQVPKTMIQVEFDNGIIGLGESYRGISRELMRAVAKELVGADLRKLNLQALPLPAGRVYDGYECALTDALAKCHEFRCISCLVVSIATRYEWRHGLGIGQRRTRLEKRKRRRRSDMSASSSSAR